MLRDKPWQTVTNRDRRQKTMLKSWALSENAVTDRDKPWQGQRLFPIDCRNLSACKNHGQTANSMVGRSESVHTQMHANSPYFGSSGYIILYFIIFYFILLYFIILYYIYHIFWYYIILNYMLLYYILYIILSYIILYYNLLYYIIFYYIIVYIIIYIIMYIIYIHV